MDVLSPVLHSGGGASMVPGISTMIFCHPDGPSFPAVSRAGEAAGIALRAEHAAE
jgi:hypothetical protein